MTVSELLGRISSKELSEWIAYARIESLEADRADLRAAIIAATIANVHRGPNQRAYKVSEFMPNFEEPKMQTAEEMKLIIKRIVGIT